MRRCVAAPNHPRTREAAKHFLAEYLVLIAGERNPIYVEGYERKLRVHLLPFFGDKVLVEITPGSSRNIGCIAHRRGHRWARLGD
jgi:hypothetical protein